MASADDAQIGAVGYLLKRAQHALRTRMDAELRNHELTAPTYAVLAAVERTPGISNDERPFRPFMQMGGLVATPS